MTDRSSTRRGGAVKLAAIGALVFLLPLSGTEANAGEVSIANFESADAVSAWAFSNGPEFPGAKGALASGAGYRGAGARLVYDFSRGGAYVKASLALNRPIDAAAIGFWVRSPPGIRIRLRVTDSSGQTLQYNLARPFTALDAESWYRQVVNLHAPSKHWGGADDGVLHGNVQSIAILVGDALGQQNLAGAVLFDEVEAVSHIGAAIDPFGELEPPPPGVLEFAAGLGVSTGFTQDGRAFDIVESLGFEWVRMGLSWTRVENQPGQYDWAPYDGVIDALDERDLGALFVLNYGNPLYGGLPTTPEAISAFAGYARAAAQHFAPDHVRFEVWNEPNHPKYWESPDASQYAELSRAAIAAIHATDPEALVATGGLSGFDFPYLRRMLSTGGARGADAIGIHPYRRTAPESITDELMLMRAVVSRELPAPLPIWDTEWGYSSTWYGGNGHAESARMRQAVLVVRELATAVAVGLKFPNYFALRDAGTDPRNDEHNFGLVTHDYAYKPAAFALRTLIEMTQGRRFAGMLELTPTSLHGLRFDGAKDSVLMLWSSAPGGEVPVTVPGSLEAAVDLFGRPIKVGATENGRMELTVSEREGPVYLTFLKPGG